MCVTRNGDDVMKKGRSTQKLQVSLMARAGRYSALYEPQEEENDEGCDSTPAGRKMTKNVASRRKYSRSDRSCRVNQATKLLVLSVFCVFLFF